MMIRPSSQNKTSVFSKFRKRRKFIGCLSAIFAGVATFNSALAQRLSRSLRDPFDKANKINNRIYKKNSLAGYVFLNSPNGVKSSNDTQTSSSERFIVISVIGSVSINGVPVRAGNKISSGSIIETSKNSYIIYRFYDEAVKVHPNSRVTHGSNPSVWAELYGTMTVAMKESTQPRAIYTPYSTVQINGTGVHLDTNYELFGKNGQPVKSEYVCTCYGKALIQRHKNRENLVRVTADHHNFPYLVTANQYLIASVIAGHSDSDLIELSNFL